MTRLPKKTRAWPIALAVCLALAGALTAPVTSATTTIGGALGGFDVPKDDNILDSVGDLFGINVESRSKLVCAQLSAACGGDCDDDDPEKKDCCDLLDVGLDYRREVEDCFL